LSSRSAQGPKSADAVFQGEYAQADGFPGVRRARRVSTGSAGILSFHQCFEHLLATGSLLSSSLEVLANLYRHYRTQDNGDQG
jgi:hypothetical protein